MKRPWGIAGLPRSAAKATRRASGGWLVGAPSGCRELRGAVECGSVLPVPDAVHRQGTAFGAGSQQRVRHTTQGTSVTTRLARMTDGFGHPSSGRPLGPPGTSTSSRSGRTRVVRIRGVARRGSINFS